MFQPMKEELRKQKLIEIMKREPVMTGIRLPFKGVDKEYSVYRIPLEYLVYNPYNGRIGTLVKTFEVKNHKLDAENSKDNEIIEQFLWDSKPDRNKKTLDSLVKMKQQQYGIVSGNGIIIDGNRRASILNKIYREREKYKRYDVTHCQFFNAVILEEDVSQREILQLETSYQMGMDEKLDYNPIEKYLKTRELFDFNYQKDEIADMMGEKEATIDNNIAILKTMDGYLEYCGYENMYSLLEKREGQFVNLSSYENIYLKGSGFGKTNWAPDKKDVFDMIQISYDYIRAKYEGKEFRYIAQNSKSNIPKSFFANKALWDDFKKKHEDIRNVEEQEIDEYLSHYSDSSKITEILNQRDNEWAKKVSHIMKRNMGQSIRTLEDIQEADKPLDLLQKAIKTLNTIDVDNPAFIDKDVLSLVEEINKLTWDFKKELKKGLKDK
ncbi:hypothetical protein PTB14_08435 [Enterococcus faecalis]|uniref:hypothetical protein n=2 Tax=Enterococcus faecalis TaxID=1351 RepID=UPI001C614623|nr:hypothetical protein [Enterococcus faecalis]EHL2501964.1 hypothetical protein [Enterococcus faecalis]EIV0121738.1 hypothetical protein [Enterococcus faecalis]MDD0850432.1 hypothetical protein [Enterococcus faecalis]MEB6094428.1 hypothetical protein [Enterococcus faecalis]HCQ8863285.1 hypothetical protein [Enterococcus faecalis]